MKSNFPLIFVLLAHAAMLAQSKPALTPHEALAAKTELLNQGFALGTRLIAHYQKAQIWEGVDANDPSAITLRAKIAEEEKEFYANTAAQKAADISPATVKIAAEGDQKKYLEAMKDFDDMADEFLTQRTRYHALGYPGLGPPSEPQIPTSSVAVGIPLAQNAAMASFSADFKIPAEDAFDALERFTQTSDVVQLDTEKSLAIAKRKSSTEADQHVYELLNARFSAQAGENTFRDGEDKMSASTLDMDPSKCNYHDVCLRNMLDSAKNNVAASAKMRDVVSAYADARVQCAAETRVIFDPSVKEPQKKIAAKKYMPQTAWGCREGFGGNDQAIGFNLFFGSRVQFVRNKRRKSRPRPSLAAGMALHYWYLSVSRIAPRLGGRKPLLCIHRRFRPQFLLRLLKRALKLHAVC